MGYASTLSVQDQLDLEEVLAELIEEIFLRLQDQGHLAAVLGFYCQAVTRDELSVFAIAWDGSGEELFKTSINSIAIPVVMDGEQMGRFLRNHLRRSMIHKGWRNSNQALSCYQKNDGGILLLSPVVASPKNQTIVLEQTSNSWNAYFDSNPKTKGVGSSQGEAVASLYTNEIGKLILQNPERFALTVITKPT
ncbi:MAG: hypothetical protein ABR884_00120 [Minisyncoccia bacterium]